MSDIGPSIQASYSAHKDFVNSLVWRDLHCDITAWLEDVRNHLETELDYPEIRRFQGIAEACRRFVMLPMTIVEALEAQTGDTNADS